MGLDKLYTLHSRIITHYDEKYRFAIRGKSSMCVLIATR